MAQPSKRNILATLKRMRKLLSRAWVQGTGSKWTAVNGRTVMGYCLIGANEKADGPSEDAAWEAVTSVVQRRYRVRGGGNRYTRAGGVTFNDHPKTTQADVLKVVDLAIEDVARR